MHYETQYAAYQQAIEGYLSGLFTADTPYKRLYESIRYSLLAGGKRIRPVLTLEFARLGGIDWMTTCAGASPPTTRSTARRWRYWRETPCSRRRSG